MKKIDVFLILIILGWLIFGIRIAKAEILANEKPQMVEQIAIFHDISSAQKWAKEMNGQVVKGQNETFIVVYKETEWVSTPNGWKDGE